MNTDEVTALHQIETRLVLLEADVGRLTGIKKLLMSVGGILVVQASFVIYGYGQLNERMENVDLSDFKQNISTALTVLGDHGTEFSHVRNEMARIQGNIDSFHEIHGDIRRLIESRTGERFYKSDGDKLEIRVLRLENDKFVHSPNGISP